MKKIGLYVICFILLPLSTLAADEAGAPRSTWTFPVSIGNLDQEMQWYFDLSGTSFTEGQDLYLWAWSPSEPDAGNWENSSEFAKLQYVGSNVWKMVLVPTEYFGQTVDQIKNSSGFWMRLKDKTGTLQSDVIQIYLPEGSVADFAAKNKMVMAYPDDFAVKSPISIFFNANLAANAESFINAPSVHLHSSANTWANIIEYHAWETTGCEPQSACYTQLINLGNGIFRKDMIPYQYYGVEETYPLVNITGLFVTTDWAATVPEFVLTAGEAPIPPTPVLSYFPNKISKNDILTITRTYNETYEMPLKYEVVATGGKTTTGEFSGPSTSQSATFYLPAEFGPSITKLHVKITAANNVVIDERDIQLTVAD